MKVAPSPFDYAKALARRFASIGINPYQSEKERYIVLLNNGGGEVLEWGRPLKGSRIFGPNAIRKDRSTVADFTAFSKQHGLRDCVFWCIGTADSKPDPSELNAALKSFNESINIEFSELRKSGSFEMLLLVIHPRFDEVSGLFDLHAHFVARVPPEDRDKVKHELRKKFSKTHFPDDPILKAAAVATYMLWGVFKNKVMLNWPDIALRAAWRLTESRFRFVRSGGSFAKWRGSKGPNRESLTNTIDEERKRQNRRETAYPRQAVVTGDRLISKIMVKIRGVRTPALLFEMPHVQREASGTENRSEKREYTSSINVVTQEQAQPSLPTGSSECLAHKGTLRHRIKVALLAATEPIKSWTSKVGPFIKRIMVRLSC